MKYLDLTLSTPAENLAADEALLEQCEAAPEAEVLRVWEPDQYFVVLGYANRLCASVIPEACQAARVPIYRRVSGGGTVLQGRGCLNYSLVLRVPESGSLGTITQTNQWVMQAHQAALAGLLHRPVGIHGITDLTLDHLKFSGNAQRRKRHSLLFHGTFLLSLDLALVERLLALPAHQPDYRAQRRHQDFLTNLNLPAPEIKTALQHRWQAVEPYEPVPWERIQKLVEEKYSRPEWNEKW